MAVVDSLTDYTRTQRILLLIDLNPLLYLQQPDSYRTTVLSAAKTLLSFPQLSSSLFSFKPFFSSLSPLLSSSKLPTFSLSLSFDHPSSTLDSLSQFFTSIDSALDRGSVQPLYPKATHVATSMRQIVHDYAWDSTICDSLTGTILNGGSVVRSNLVVLFSPVLRDLKCLSEFMGVGFSDECLRDVNVFTSKLRGFFENVGQAFASRDIHFTWVDVKSEIDSNQDRGDCCQFDPGLRCFQSVITDLGWGFCSSDCVVLGSVFVPFGLIYPKIGISPKLFDVSDCSKRIHAQLNLEIQDVSGKPLECKFCDLELVSLKMCHRVSLNFTDSEAGSCEEKKVFWNHFHEGLTKLHVKAVKIYDKPVSFDSFSSNPLLVCESSGNNKNDGKESCSDFIEDRVLDILGAEMGKLAPRSSQPIWQILLSFLYKEGFLAMVSLSNVKGYNLMGILKPFTHSLALLWLMEDALYPHGMTNRSIEEILGTFLVKKDSESFRQESDLNLCNEVTGSQSSPPLAGKCNELGVEKRKRDKRILNMLRELKWDAFCEAALEGPQIDLEEAYISRSSYKLKKMKFLKCWMKQSKKSSECRLTQVKGFKPYQAPSKEAENNRLSESLQENEQPIASCASAGEDSLTGASRIQDEDANDFRPESAESFFSDLPHKIQQGLESEEVDLCTLAERLVNSTIYWIYQRGERVTASEIQKPLVKQEDASTSMVCLELIKLLLREPKDLAAMYRASNPSFQVSALGFSEDAARKTTREYELQILFRLEILQSEVGGSVGESTKQKFVKHICLLLETIQCHLEGGFFGDWNLDKYVEKIIKSRYSDSLEEVVHRIYSKMDLLLFDEEDESPNPLLNSEDSNQSWRGKLEGDKLDESYRNGGQVSAEDESLRLVEKDNQSLTGLNQDEHTRKLIEAQERRQRARRFASFTSWVPDLQRVWAPKQSKAMKVKSNPFRKPANRKGQRDGGYGRVCETPMTGNTRTDSGGSRNNKKGHHDSVSKALFQDD
ncbi:hypothetical protein K2173_028387 [Erythroxylum novogranatense]|uniref:Treslin n=1 Tax=Erythroxylum novogranatense TaxID=1862640 RepID=A0AAV8U4E8_9ROSI|nr:hypothetical protein K2173_028387 [Erythroxylum novogranatense]